MVKIVHSIFELSPADPQKYERPIEAQTTLSLQPTHINPNRIISRTGSLPRNAHASKHSLQSSNRATATQPMQISSTAQNPQQHRSSQNRMKHSPSKSAQIRERVNTLQNSTAKATIRAANKPQLDQDPGIVDGYLENVRLVNRIHVLVSTSIENFTIFL